MEHLTPNLWQYHEKMLLDRGTPFGKRISMQNLRKGSFNIPVISKKR